MGYLLWKHILRRNHIENVINFLRKFHSVSVIFRATVHWMVNTFQATGSLFKKKQNWTRCSYRRNTK